MERKTGERPCSHRKLEFLNLTHTPPYHPLPTPPKSFTGFPTGPALTSSLPDCLALFSVPVPRRSFSPLFVLMGARVFPQHPQSWRTSSENSARSRHRSVQLTRRHDIMAQLLLFKEGVQLPARRRNGETGCLCPHAPGSDHPQALQTCEHVLPMLLPGPQPPLFHTPSHRLLHHT